MIPAAVCDTNDPARILILNFRTKPYGPAHSEILAFDMTVDWKLSDWNNRDTTTSNWYTFYNATTDEKNDLKLDPKDVGRDASGILLVENRYMVNFGGTYHYYDDTHGRRKRGRFSMIRAFDVCNKKWSIVGDLSLQTFALQTAASANLQVALTCGGEAPLRNSNSPYCFVTRFHNGWQLSISVNRAGALPFHWRLASRL